MNRNFFISALIICFGFSAVGPGWAAEVMQVSPIIVQPYGLPEMWVSRYGDLITLTEDTDAMTEDRGYLEGKSGLLAQRYQMLTDLKDEMTALDDKLRDEGLGASDQKEKIIEGYKKIAQEQQDKIQMLVERLGEVDQKISHFDEIMAQKDQQMARLKDSLVMAKNELKAPMPLSPVIVQLSAPSGAVELPSVIIQSNVKSPVSGVVALPPVIVNASNGQQLAKKQEQIDLLKEELEHKITELQARGSNVAAAPGAVEIPPVVVQPNDNESVRWLRQVLAVAKEKAEYYKLTSQEERISLQQVQGEVRDIKEDFAQHMSWKEDQIAKMKADIQAILQTKANEEKDSRKSSVRLNENMDLARQLIDLQQQETALLDEKSDLEADQNAMLDRHFLAFENKVKRLLADHQVQNADMQNRIQALKDELDQERQQVDSLKTQVQSAQEVKQEADSLKQQLDSKIAQSDKMTLMMANYQKKLESRDSAYNEQLRQILFFKNYQARMEAQVADLNAQVQEKEAQVVKIKKDMYDLQQWANAKDSETQAKDLSLAMAQQKAMDEKINGYQDKINGLQAMDDEQVKEITSLKTDLALVREELAGMPSSDEINFLRTGLKKATIELAKKDQALSQIKADFDEYAKEFKSQTREFKSLKDQLVQARQEMDRQTEDLKYKNMEVTRLKERSVVREGDLQDQIRALTGKREVLPKGDRLREKLQQALDKINEQGRLVGVLTQKLQACGKQN